MKKWVPLYAVLIISACTTSRQDGSKGRSDNKGGIVYMLPDTVQRLLENNIKPGIDYYLQLEQNEDSYRVFLHKKPPGFNKYYLSRTNRKVYIGGRFYLLVSDLDLTFAINESEKSLLDKYATSRYPDFNKVSLLNEGSFNITFLKNGTILTTGFDGVKVRAQ